MATTTITLSITLESNQWLATWDGDGAAQVEDLFGTRTLPTPYGIYIQAGHVLANIRRLNPNCIVQLAPELRD